MPESKTFKKRRGIKLSYEQQGLVYFTCINYKSQPKWMREKIDKLCRQIGGMHADALKQVMTTGRSVRQISLECYISESVLYELRREFYEQF